MNGMQYSHGESVPSYWDTMGLRLIKKAMHFMQGGPLRRPLRIVLLGRIEAWVIEEVVSIASRELAVDAGVIGSIECHIGFDPARGQRRADRVITECIKRSSSPGEFCVGLTGADLYVPSLNFVFGLALRDDGLAVVSWHRLQSKAGLLPVRLAKEIVHEVGHLEGLEHCSNESCVMWFSNTLLETDRKGSSFCSSCTLMRGA